MEFKMKRTFFEKYRGTNLVDDPLPLKVFQYSIWHNELMGHVLDTAGQYLQQKSCPDTLLSPLLGKILQEISREDLSSCYSDSCKQSSQDEVDSEEVSNISYQPLKLMHSITSKVDELCLRYKEEYEQIETDFPNETPNQIFGVTHHSIKNTRRTLEDRAVILPKLENVFPNARFLGSSSFFAVFDGHNGIESASYAAAHLHYHLVTSPDFPSDYKASITYAFEATDTALLMKSKDENIRSGTTAVIALLVPGNIYVAWVGDSQAVLVRNSKPINLVSPHKPDREDEMARIRSAGGEVIQLGGTWRVNGSLAVSRAIGDRDYKDCVTSTPEINHIVLDGQEEFLILACDGLWDCVEPQTCVDIFKQCILSENPGDIDAVSQKFVKEAKTSGSGDNITVVTILLKSKEELRKIYSKDTNMNGVEEPVTELLLGTTVTESEPPVLEPASPMAEPNNPNMEPLDTESPILAPKSPVSPVQPLLIESKSPKTPKTSKAAPLRNSATPLKSTAPGLKGTPRSSLLATTKKSSPSATTKSLAPKTPAKVTERVPATTKAPPVPLARKTTAAPAKTTLQSKPTGTGAKPSTAPRTTTTTTTAPRPATKTATTIATKKLKPDETEKPTTTSTTLKSTALPKTRPTTAPSASSRLVAAKTVTSTSSVTSKVGGEPGKTESTVRNRNVPTSARSTTAAAATTPKEATSTRVTSATTRPPTTARPRPQTTGATTKPKPPASTTSKPAASKPPTTKTTSQPLKTTVASKVGATKAPLTTKKSPATPATNNTTTNTRQPIRRPPGHEKQKKDDKSGSTTVSSKVIEKLIPSTSANESDGKDSAATIVNGLTTTTEPTEVVPTAVEETEVKKIANGDIITNTDSFMVTKPYNVAENIIDSTTTEIKEDLSNNDAPVIVETVERSFTNEVEAVSTTNNNASVSETAHDDILLNEMNVANSSESKFEETNEQVEQQNLSIPKEDDVQQQEIHDVVTSDEPVVELISQDIARELNQDKIEQEEEKELLQRHQSELETVEASSPAEDVDILSPSSPTLLSAANVDILSSSSPVPALNDDTVILSSSSYDGQTEQNQDDVTQELVELHTDDVIGEEITCTSTAATIDSQESKSVENLNAVDSSELMEEVTTVNVNENSDALSHGNFDNQQDEQSHFIIDQHDNQLEEKQRQSFTGDNQVTSTIESVVQRDPINIADDGAESQIQQEIEGREIENIPFTTSSSIIQDAEISSHGDDIQSLEIQKEIETNLLPHEGFNEPSHQEVSDDDELRKLNLDAQNVEKNISSQQQNDGEDQNLEIHSTTNVITEEFQGEAPVGDIEVNENEFDKFQDQKIDFTTNNNRHQFDNEFQPQDDSEVFQQKHHIDDIRQSEVELDPVVYTNEGDLFSAQPQGEKVVTEVDQNPFYNESEMFSTQPQVPLHLQHGTQNPFSTDDAFFTQQRQLGDEIIASSFNQNPFGNQLDGNVGFNEEPQQQGGFDFTHQFDNAPFTTEEKEHPSPSGLPPGCVNAAPFIPKQYNPSSTDQFSAGNFTADDNLITTSSQLDYDGSFPGTLPSSTYTHFTNGNSADSGVSNGDTKLEEKTSTEKSPLIDINVLDAENSEIGGLGGEVNKTVLDVSHGLCANETAVTSDDPFSANF